MAQTVPFNLARYRFYMLIGYARISTTDQSLDLQLDALKAAGCERIFQDVASGAKDDRKGFEEAITFARPGDVLVAWRLDRVGRNVHHLTKIVNELKQRQIGFKTLNGEIIDTTSIHGMLIFHVFAAIAEYERGRTLERTHAGLAAARARGKIGGRPPAMDNKKLAIAKAMYSDKANSITSICETLDISRGTFYKYIKTAQKS